MHKTDFIEIVEQFIQNIEQINLADIDAYDNIKNEFSKLPFVPHFTVPLEKGYKFYRCRPNRKAEYFGLIKDLTQRPAHEITDFGRCNTPGMTVFYCSEYGLYSFIELLHTLDIELLTGDLAAITISEWELLSDLRLAVVLNPGNSMLMERYFQIFQSDFNWIIDQQAIEERDGLRMFFKFLAEKFSLSSIPDKNIYKLTSSYAEWACREYQIDGLIYPSVQYHSHGINFALKAEVVNQKKIEIRSVIKTMYRKGKQDNGLSDFIQIPELEERAVQIIGDRVEW